jgi:hypothetical protein
MPEVGSALTPKQIQRKAHYQANREKYLADVKAWRLANPEKFKAQCERQYAKNKERDIARIAAWKRDNPDKLRQSGVNYRQKNPARVQAHVRAYQAAKAKATPPWVEFDELVPFYELARSRSGDGTPHEVDHIVPLRSKLVCGLHCPANLQVIPRRDNRQKHNRYWPDMP